MKGILSPPSQMLRIKPQISTDSKTNRLRSVKMREENSGLHRKIISRDLGGKIRNKVQSHAQTIDDEFDSPKPRRVRVKDHALPGFEAQHSSL